MIRFTSSVTPRPLRPNKGSRHVVISYSLLSVRYEFFLQVPFFFTMCTSSLGRFNRKLVFLMSIGASILLSPLQLRNLERTSLLVSYLRSVVSLLTPVISFFWPPLKLIYITSDFVFIKVWNLINFYYIFTVQDCYIFMYVTCLWAPPSPFHPLSI